MSKYYVKITETISHIVSIEADDAAVAKLKVAEKYSNCDIVLGETISYDECSIGTSFDVVSEEAALSCGYNVTHVTRRYHYIISTVSIDYHIDDGDLDFSNCSELDKERLAQKVLELRSQLPQKVDLEFECDEDQLDNTIASKISERTDWLVNNIKYNIISQDEV